MDDRKSNIRDLEGKNRADSDARNQLLKGLGEVLLRKTEGGELFPGGTGIGPNAALAGELAAEYRRLQSDLAESARIIKTLEEDGGKLKDLEEKIGAREEERVRLENEFSEACALLGGALLGTPGSPNVTEASVQQEEALLSKIDELENKLKELEEKEGGVIAWLRKGAQIAVSKSLLAKNRAALGRLYRTIGEKFLDAKPAEAPEGEAGTSAARAEELKGQLSALTAELAELKGERRRIHDLFGVDGSPSRRIQGLEKHIAHVKGEFAAVYLRFGLLAAKNANQKAEGDKTLSALLDEEDVSVLEKAEALNAQIAERELGIKKINAAIKIDEEKADIEKTKKAILNQRKKIKAAEEEIEDLEKHIAETGRHIEELQAFLL